MASIKAFTPYIRRQRRWFFLIVPCTLGGALLTTLQPWPVKLIVDHLLGAEPWPPFLQRWLGEGSSLGTSLVLTILVLGGLAIFVLTALLDAALTWMWTKAGQRMVHDLGEDLFARLQRRSLQFHRRASLGDLMSRVTGDSWCVHHLVDTFLFAPLHAVLMIFLMSWLMWQLDTTLTWITVLLAPAVVLGSMIIGQPLRRAALQRRESEGSMHSHLQQMLTGIPVVQGFVQEETERARFQGFADSAIRAMQRSTLLGSLNQLASGFLATLGTGLVLWLGAHRVLDGTMTVGALLVFLSYLAMLQAQIRVLAGLFTSYQRIRASMQRVEEILQVEPEIRERPGARDLQAVQGHVTLERVTFGYEAGRPVLKEVSLEMAPGRTLALLGATGAGKTTLASLLLRFADPWEGSVALDGTDLREVKLASLRSQVSILFQEPFLLPVTVAENIAFGRPDATREEIVAAARAAQADEFIRRLPDGYDTVLSERGGTFSGGERQRLAIARAFLKDAPVLVLDEPTSALDAGKERELMEALRQLMAGRTTLLIAHRLSTVREADQIAVLKDGSLVELGDHASLLAAGGHYARFHRLQTLPDEQSAPAPS